MRQFHRVATLLTLCSAASAGDGPCLDWEPVSAPNLPPARYGGAMVYDAARGVVLLYGGAISNQQYLDEMWQWDGVTWSQLATPPVNPGERSFVQLVFNPHDGKVYLYGGLRRIPTGGSYSSPDLWSWDGESWSLEWQAQTISQPPYGRTGSAFVYDSARRRIVLHAGWQTGSDYFGILRDLYEWDGAAWSLGSVGFNTLGVMGWHASYFDTALEKTVILGFAELVDDQNLQFLTWDGAEWAAIDTPLPPVRHRPIHGFDAHRGQFLVAGGRRGLSTLVDTWAWNGSAWAQVNSGPAPSMVDTAFCVDGDGRLLVFGGRTSMSAGAPITNQMWRLAPAPLLGDIDGDALVGMSDLMTVVDAINTAGDDLPGDVNADGVVSFVDLNIIVSNYNQTCP